MSGDQIRGTATISLKTLDELRQRAAEAEKAKKRCEIFAKRLMDCYEFDAQIIAAILFGTVVFTVNAASANLLTMIVLAYVIISALTLFLAALSFKKHQVQ